MYKMDNYERVASLIDIIQVDKVYPCSIVEGTHPLYIL